MNLQEKLIENAAQIRARAGEITATAIATARTGASRAAERLELLKSVGQGLNTVTRRHATRFVKQNRTLAMAAGKDLRGLVRSTFATFAADAAPTSRARRKPVAARRRNAKAG
jgi:hypothetical protein